MHKSLVLTLLIFTAACQQVPIASEPGDDTTSIEGKTIINNLCADGTMSCIVDNTTTNNVVVNNSAFTMHEYDQCLRNFALAGECTNVPASFLPLGENGQIDFSQVLETTQADITDSFNNAGISCMINGVQKAAGLKAEAITACTEEYFGEGTDWKADDFTFPENARVVQVEIKTCISEEHRSAMIFSGAQFSMDTVYRNDGVLSLTKPPHVSKCGPGGIFDGTKVTYKPHTSSTMHIHGKDFSTTPFTGAAAEETTNKLKNFWHAPIGVPAKYRDQMNLNGARWFMSKAEANFIWDIRLSTGNGSGSVFVTSEYMSKSRYLGFPMTMVRFARPLTSYKFTTTMNFVAPPLD